MRSQKLLEAQNRQNQRYATIKQVKKERTKLHTSDIMLWLRKRHQETANLNYLHSPEELQKNLDILNIFQSFDEDRSGKLGLGEFYNLLKEVNIEIDLNDVRNFYEQIDDDGDVALDFREFKNGTLSDNANSYFAKMMKKVEQKSQKDTNKSLSQIQRDHSQNYNPQKPKKQFLPRTFGLLLNYVTYEGKKKNLKQVAKESKLTIPEKFDHFRSLYDLQMDKDIYCNRFYTEYNSIPNSPNRSKDFSFLSNRERAQNIITETNAKQVETENFDLNSVENSPTSSPKHSLFKKELEKIISDAKKSAQKECLEKQPPPNFQPYMTTVSEPNAKRKNLFSRCSIEKTLSPMNRFRSSTANQQQLGSLFQNTPKATSNHLKTESNAFDQATKLNSEFDIIKDFRLTSKKQSRPKLRSSNNHLRKESIFSLERKLVLKEEGEDEKKQFRSLKALINNKVQLNMQEKEFQNKQIIFDSTLNKPKIWTPPAKTIIRLKPKDSSKEGLNISQIQKIKLENDIYNTSQISIIENIPSSPKKFSVLPKTYTNISPIFQTRSFREKNKLLSFHN